MGKKSHEYKLSDADILLISTASSLHDIGKISIDEKILNKPGRLTKDEFEIVKQHSLIGAEMLKTVPNYNNNDLLIKYVVGIMKDMMDMVILMD